MHFDAFQGSHLQLHSQLSHLQPLLGSMLCLLLPALCKIHIADICSSPEPSVPRCSDTCSPCMGHAVLASLAHSRDPSLMEIVQSLASAYHQAGNISHHCQPEREYRLAKSQRRTIAERRCWHKMPLPRHAKMSRIPSAHNGFPVCLSSICCERPLAAAGFYCLVQAKSSSFSLS